jgi:hypothetical protein
MTYPMGYMDLCLPPENPDDPYEWIWGLRWRDRLRQVGALDGLTASDARRTAHQIGALTQYYFSRDHFDRGTLPTDHPADPRLIEQLHNGSVNAPARVDGMNWDEPDRVGQVFAVAKAAATHRPEVVPT